MAFAAKLGSRELGWDERPS